jgi:alkanesulfonate monooxygenase
MKAESADTRPPEGLPGEGGIEIFSTCPQSTDVPGSEYATVVARAARWSERHGCTGALVYSDNRLADPWLVSHIMIQQTRSLAPLVAVQPVYMHPYAVATMVATFAHVYRRRILLNLVAGGFRNDLLALGDPTPHDQRYERLTEFGLIVRRLVEAKEPVTLDGKFYQVKGLTLSPPVAPDVRLEMFVSGSSAAGRECARVLGARPVAYANHPGEEQAPPGPASEMPGLRVGILARETSEEAWSLAHRRFPSERRGQLMHQLARKLSDSEWYAQLAEAAERQAGHACYWMVPFTNYKTMCPYLVGSHDEVARELSRYLALGYRTFILDIPRSEADVAHAREAFRQAERVTSRAPAVAQGEARGLPA